MNAALIVFGVWAIAAPLASGNAATTIFYSNLLLGLSLIIIACWRLCGCHSKKK